MDPKFYKKTVIIFRYIYFIYIVGSILYYNLATDEVIEKCICLNILNVEEISIGFVIG